MRPRSVLSAREYRSAIAATNSSRVAMLIRLIPDPADEHRPGANQMRQWLSFRDRSRRGNAPSHPDRRATTELKPRPHPDHDQHAAGIYQAIALRFYCRHIDARIQANFRGEDLEG